VRVTRRAAGGGGASAVGASGTAAGGNGGNGVALHNYWVKYRMQGLVVAGLYNTIPALQAWWYRWWWKWINWRRNRRIWNS
jgi:hypothetical protein